MDTRIAGTKTKHNLALVHEDLQEWPRALDLWRQITADEPDYVPAWRRLVELLIRMGRLDEAKAVADRLRSRLETRIAGHILLAKHAERSGDFNAALELLSAAVRDE